MNWKKIKIDFLLASFSHFFYKIVGYLILTMLTRYLTKDDMGVFFFAASMANLFIMVAELGINTYLTREIAREPKGALDFVSEVISLRIPLYIVYFVLLNGFTYFVKPDLQLIVFLTSLYTFFDRFYQLFGSLFISLKRVKYNVISGVSTRIILIALVLWVVLSHGSLTAIVICYIIANFLLVLLAFFIMRFKIGPVMLIWNSDRVLGILKASIPFFILSLLSLVHFKIDSLMLGFLRPYSEVATYEAAYKLLEASRFIIMPISMIFFPIFSEMCARNEWLAIRRLFKKLLLGLGGLGGLISLIVGLSAGFIIPAVFGPKYDESILILKILYLTVPFLYVGTVGGLVAKSILLEKKTIIILLTCVIINIILNIFFIPQWGASGAAWTTLVTHVILCVWMILVNQTELRMQCAALSKE